MNEGREPEGGTGGRAGLALALRVSAALVGLVVQGLLARWLGAREYGLLSYALAWLAVLAPLCPAGLSSTVVRFLPASRAAGEIGLAHGLIGFGRRLALGGGTLVALVAIAVALRVPGAVDAAYAAPLALALLALPLWAVVEFNDGVGRAMSWVGPAMVPAFLLRPATLALTTGALLALGAGARATTAATAMVVAALAAAAVQWAWMRVRIRAALGPAPAQTRGRAWIAESLPMWARDGLITLRLNLDVLLLQLFVAPEQLALYFVCGRVVAAVSFVKFAASNAIVGHLSGLLVVGRVDDVRQLLARSAAWTFWPALAIAAVLVAFAPQVLSLFGPEFAGGRELVAVLAVGHLVRAAVGVTDAVLVVGVDGRRALAITVLAVLSCGALCLLWVPRLGPLGAALASSSALSLEAVLAWLATRRALARRG